MFSCSNGWFKGFLIRHNLVLRRVTTAGRELPKNTKASIAIFFGKCILSVNQENFDLGSIGNMDESSIYIDCPSACTYTFKGSKRVKVDTHGGDMVRVGLAVCGLANG